MPLKMNVWTTIDAPKNEYDCGPVLMPLKMKMWTTLDAPKNENVDQS